MIYTSYFGRLKTITAADPAATFVAVCGGLPEWWKCGGNLGRLKKLAPRLWWWREWREKFGENTESDESKAWYREKYKTTVLDGLDPAATLAEIEDMSAHGSNVYLLCYERPEKFCHRHILAEWLSRNTGTAVEEWEPDHEDKT